MKTILFVSCIILVCSGLTNSLSAQGTTEVERTIRSLDSAFWLAYNMCDVGAMKKYVTDDLEFYHDKGGLMKGVDEFLAATKLNLCGDVNFRLRREAVEVTVQFYPMQNDGKYYGAILTGQHVFYIVQSNKAPRPDGLARFTHLWIFSNDEWKMSRVLSYDHGPVPYTNKRQEIRLSKKELNKHAGTYRAPNAGKCTVIESKGLLQLTIGDKIYQLHPETSTRFFQTDRDLTFDFVDGKMIVREHGEIVEEAVRTK